MNAVLEATLMILLAVVAFYANRLGRRMNALARVMQTVVDGIAPSARVRTLVARPEGRVEAMKAFREETGVGVREAKAVIDLLLEKRD